MANDGSPAGEKGRFHGAQNVNGSKGLKGLARKMGFKVRECRRNRRWGLYRNLIVGKRQQPFRSSGEASVERCLPAFYEDLHFNPSFEPRHPIFSRFEQGRAPGQISVAAAETGGILGGNVFLVDST